MLTLKKKIQTPKNFNIFADFYRYRYNDFKIDFPHLLFNEYILFL